MATLNVIFSYIDIYLTNILLTVFVFMIIKPLFSWFKFYFLR